MKVFSIPPVCGVEESSLQVEISSPATTASIKQEPEDHLKQEPEDHLKQEPEDHMDLSKFKALCLYLFYW